MNMPNLASWNSWRAFKFSGVGWYVDCADAAKLEKHASARTRNFFKQKLRRVIFLTPMEFSHGHSTTGTHTRDSGGISRQKGKFPRMKWNLQRRGLRQPSCV